MIKVDLYSEFILRYVDRLRLICNKTFSLHVICYKTNVSFCREVEINSPFDLFIFGSVDIK